MDETGQREQAVGVLRVLEERAGVRRLVGRLRHDGRMYRFTYDAGAVRDGARPLLGFPSLRTVYSAAHLFPFFAQRIGREHRVGRGATALEILARTGGRALGDAYVLEPELPA